MLRESAIRRPGKAESRYNVMLETRNDLPTRKWLLPECGQPFIKVIPDTLALKDIGVALACTMKDRCRKQGWTVRDMPQFNRNVYIDNMGLWV